MLEQLKLLGNHLLLKHRIPEYQEKADFCRARAYVDSLQAGFVVDPDRAVDLIDVTETSALVLPNKRRVEFAVDRDGVCFARIEDGKYYPTDTKLSDLDLDLSHKYDRLSRSFWRRLLKELSGPKARQSEALLFEVYRTSTHILDISFMLSQTLEEVDERLKEKTKEPQSPQLS